MAALHQPPTEHDLELLSAYLDGELSDRERATLERRLEQETALRRELDDLHSTVVLLNQLPRLKAPRNFTLDPALYNRTVPWWKRVFSLENTLQLSGVLGAVASVVLIVLALLANSGDLAQQIKESDTVAGGTASESVALQPSPSPALTIMANYADQTAIAYAGEDLLQTTMVAQSTLYALSPDIEGTPEPGLYTEENGVVMSIQADTDTTTLLEDTAETETVVTDGVTSDDMAGDTAIAAAQSAAEAPVPLAGAASGADTSAEQFEAGAEETAPLNMAPSSSITGPAETATATAFPADTGADASTAIGQVARDVEEDESGETPAESQATAVQPSTQSTGISTTPAAKISVETSRAARNNGNNTALLAAAGVIMLTLSIGLFILGRKKAHRT